MKDAVASEFEETLKRMNWPRKDIDLTTELEVEWTAGVEKLLDLQEPYVPSRILLHSQAIPYDFSGSRTL